MTAWLFNHDNFLYGSTLLILLTVLLVQGVGLVFKSDIFGLFYEREWSVLGYKDKPVDILHGYWYSVSGSGWVLLFLLLFSVCGLMLQHALIYIGITALSEIWIFLVSSATSFAIIGLVLLRLHFSLRQITSDKIVGFETTQPSNAKSGLLATIIQPASAPDSVANAMLKAENQSPTVVKVTPVDTCTAFQTGDQVILIKRGIDCWLAVHNSSCNKQPQT